MVSPPRGQTDGQTAGQTERHDGQQSTRERAAAILNGGQSHEKQNERDNGGQFEKRFFHRCVLSKTRIVK